MELTDPGVLFLLGGIALVVFALVVAGRPRWGNGAAAAGTRAVQVVLLNVVVVALCGAALNDQYLFYSSWGDLLGSHNSVLENTHGGTLARTLTAHVAGPGFAQFTPPTDLPALPQPGERLQSYTVVDAGSGSSREVLVYLPVGYNPTSSHAYPVIVGLHGFPGSPHSFVKNTFLSSLDNLTARHLIAPTIMVIPRIDTPSDLDTECVNGPVGQPQTDTWLAHDLPLWTTHHFRVQRSRTSWAAVGYSYGAWCASSIAMRHPDVYGAAVSLAGYFRPDFGTAYDPLTRSTLGAYDLVNIARTDPPPVAMWVLTSRDDGLSYPTTSKFLSVAKPPLAITSTVLAHGGHRNGVWSPYVPDALAWLGRSIPGFRA
jgi:pimeloyl-ACP methyl ester carboxylesterase